MNHSGFQDSASPVLPTGSAAADISQAAPAGALTKTDPGSAGGNGNSLAELASRDLDAALQLLAERAQYITDATGAAIALRRGDHNDMLCRASTGSTAPELGALLSMEYGLSGESLRTREVQRCDDAQNDARVNREACRRLGIASVVVMPIVSGDQALGVFELFSGRRYAFEERDISAIQRLSSMVELAIRFAVAAQATMQESYASRRAPDPASTPLATFPETVATEAAAVESNPKSSVATVPQIVPAVATPEINGALNAAVPDLSPELTADRPRIVAGVPMPPATLATPRTEIQNAHAKPEIEEAGQKAATQTLDQNIETGKANLKTGVERSKPEPSQKKPLFWSAQVDQSKPPEPDVVTSAPPTLRKLKKCQACGFPISQDRTFCVECEEKQWHGRPLSPKVHDAAAPLLPKTTADDASNDASRLDGPKKDDIDSTRAVTVAPPAQLKSQTTGSSIETSATPQPPPANLSSAPSSPVPARSSTAAREISKSHAETQPNSAADAATAAPVAADTSAPFLSSAIQSDSWFAANKYVIAVLILVAIILAAFAIVR